MKKILQLTFAIMLANITTTFGQTNSSILNGPINVYPPNGNWTSSINFFDPTKTKQFHIIHDDAGRLAFGYDGSGKMTLLGNGNLGIGTYSPITKLDVRGSIIAGNTDLIIGSVGSFLQIQQGASSGNTYSEIGAYSNGGNALNNLILNRTAGNVGIGTSAPQSKLQVAGTISIAPISTSESRALNFMASDGSNAKYASIESNSTSGNLQIKSGGFNSGVGFSTSFFTDELERMRIAPNGNVGIGTLDKLYQTLNINGGIGFANFNNADKKLYSPIDGDLEWMTHNLAAGHGFAISHQGTKAVYLNTTGNSYFNGGFVGIGTTTPTNTLTIDSKTTNSGLTLTGLKSTLQVGANRPIAVNDLGEVVLLGGGVGTGDIWTRSGDNIYRSAGNVGIGTTTPESILHIANNTKYGITNGLAIGGSTNVANDFVSNFYTENIRNGVLHINTRKSGIGFGDVALSEFDGGKVGVGTTNPSAKLEVNGSASQIEVALFKGNGGAAAFRFYNDINKGITLSTYKSDYPNTAGSPFGVGANGSIVVQTANAPMAVGTWEVAQPLLFGTSSLERMRISADGNVGIGVSTLPTGYKLAVGGDMIAERVVVKLQTNWPDYVFTPSYHREALSEVEKYINLNHHLPNVPSAKEVSENGIDIGSMNTKMMEKIEELTLYLIEQSKKIEALEKKNLALEKAIINIKK